MADVHIIDNATRRAGDELAKSLERATDVRIATAFATQAALGRILPSMEKVLDRNGKVTMMYALDGYITDAEVIEQFGQLAKSYPNAKQYARLAWGNTTHQTFHTKLYIAIQEEQTAQVLVGSSNLTIGGLWKNTEANALLQGALNDDAIQDACKVYIRIRDDPSFVIPDESVTARYRDLKRRAASHPISSRPPAALAAAFKELQDLIQTRRSV